MGKGSSPKQKESQAEKQRAQNALNRIKEWENDGFKELELEGLQRAKMDHTERLRRTTNADVQQQASEASKDLGVTVGQGNFVYEQDQFNTDVNTTLGKANTESIKTAETLKDNARLDMAKVGQDVAMSTDAAFSSAAQRGAAKARNKLENKTLRSRARTQALASVVAGAGMGYSMKNSGPKTTNQNAGVPDNLGSLDLNQRYA